MLAPYLVKLRLLRWPQVWDYVYLDGPEPSGSRIPAELLQTMRREFLFWYAFLSMAFLPPPVSSFAPHG